MSQDGDDRRLAMASTGLGWANAATATGRASSWAKPQQSHPAGLGWPVPGGDGASSSPAVSRETGPGAEQVMTDEANPTAPPGPVSRETLSLIHISEPTRLLSISYAVFCLKK